ncbi:hypothetical protein SEVIR_9G237200v4 [Setaria viridis]|uniref:WRC domain-containing protein n=1 Tax=Setaria viridis TaxID=4556 RepID=A0A4U6SZ52_SETVI|nr:uncharacterized protein LOC117836950 isoform X1 [Setaria viridis]TKV93614.1 hypothetical protein SEVIR_9G237200v2 [Setaria viridis]
MRIRKRTPARAADPGPATALSASPPSSQPLLHHPKERSREEDETDEKRVILIAGVRVQEEEGDRVPAAAASNDSSAMDDDVPKPQPQPQGARCSRNDGKRWRCKGAAVPGYLFCDRHIAWSSRKRKPRPRKHEQQQHGSGGLGPPTAKGDVASAEEDTPELGHDGGFQKRAKGGETWPAA